MMASIFQMRVLFWVACAAFTLPLPAMAGSKAFTTYGNIFQAALPVAAAALTSARDDGEGLKQFAYSGLATLGTTYALKYAIDSKRPNGGSHSFPSGHTSSAFWGASYIHERYGWQLGFPAEILAAAVAGSRVDAKAHHWRDVIASALIADTSAYFLVTPHDSGVLLTPWSNGPKGSFGIAGKVHF